MELTQERLKEVIRYDLLTGQFTSLVKRSSNAPSGISIGTKLLKGRNHYYKTSVDGQRYYLHQLAFLYVLGRIPESVDHINGDGLDNRWINLRPASKQANGRNCKKYLNNKSGIMGVNWDNHAKKWRASINMSQKYYHLGLSDSFFEACCIRKSAELKYGFHDNHGR